MAVPVVALAPNGPRQHRILLFAPSERKPQKIQLRRRLSPWIRPRYGGGSALHTKRRARLSPVLPTLRALVLTLLTIGCIVQCVRVCALARTSLLPCR